MPALRYLVTALGLIALGLAGSVEAHSITVDLTPLPVEMSVFGLD